MKKRGFTLIELLAVIVLLAIIALIATPIVMKLISNAQEGANARSVEGYMKAYEAAYYDYMLHNGGKRPSGKLDITTADYSGSTVNCEGITVTDGKFTATCSIDGQDGLYSYVNGKATKVGSGSVEGSTPNSPNSPSQPSEP